MRKRNSVRGQLGLIAGMSLLFLGGSLLLWTVGNIPYALTIIPLLLVCLGVLCLYSYYLDLRDVNLFLGMGFILAALFLFIKHKFPEVYLQSYWPIFPLIIGIALLLFSLRKNRRRRIVTFVPGVTFIILSLLFLPFSLGITEMRFLDFIKRWWPASFLILGIVLVISHFFRSVNKRKQNN